MLGKLFPGHRYYFRINRERISARNVNTGDVFESSAKLAIDDRKIVVSVGDPVAPTATQVIEPFKHPRVLVADYTVAEKIVQHSIKQLAKLRPFSLSPTLVIHPDLTLAGGITPIEERALRDMAFGAGARHVLLHEGDVLSDDEVLEYREGD